MNIRIKATVGLFVLDDEFDVIDEIGLQSELLDRFKDDFGFEVTDKCGKESINIEVTNWGDVEYYKNLQDLDELGNIDDVKNDVDLDVISAARELGIDYDNIVNAYSGQYDSDEDFARQMADDCGSLRENNTWPYRCIDWEQAARELMYDYSEERGYYFNKNV